MNNVFMGEKAKDKKSRLLIWRSITKGLERMLKYIRPHCLIEYDVISIKADGTIVIKHFKCEYN